MLFLRNQLNTQNKGRETYHGRVVELFRDGNYDHLYIHDVLALNTAPHYIHHVHDDGRNNVDYVEVYCSSGYELQAAYNNAHVFLLLTNL
jgi:hypothetical protein